MQPPTFLANWQLRIDVELQNPADLHVTMSLARTYELRTKTAPVAPLLGSGQTGARPSGCQRSTVPLPVAPRLPTLGGTPSPPAPTTTPTGRPLR